MYELFNAMKALFDTIWANDLIVLVFFYSLTVNSTYFYNRLTSEDDFQKNSLMYIIVGMIACVFPPTSILLLTIRYTIATVIYIRMFIKAVILLWGSTAEEYKKNVDYYLDLLRGENENQMFVALSGADFIFMIIMEIPVMVIMLLKSLLLKLVKKENVTHVL